MGHAPDWYKLTILGFLMVNPIILATLGPVAAGWALIAEFIFTLAMALKCYPLQPGGLLAFEGVIIGLTSTATVFHELEQGFDVILLLIFMVAGIYFLKDMLLFGFTKILLRVKSKPLLGLLFCLSGAILSAFLDALTVTAVVMAVGMGFYTIYHRVASGREEHHTRDPQSSYAQSSYNSGDDKALDDAHRQDLEQFRAFLRSLVMHAAVGTALGGVCTMVGEPQNLLIASQSGWGFSEFFIRMAPVTLPVLVMGLVTCVCLEIFGWFGYGAKLPARTRQILLSFEENRSGQRSQQQKVALVVQAVVALWLVFALTLHLAPVGLIGLSVIILATALTGIIEEHQIGRAFEEALPFTALLTVFFAVVAVINDQKLFSPIVEAVLRLDSRHQVGAFYLANGILSSISDNVFVASVYIGEIKRALLAGEIGRDQYDLLAVAINTGTNIPSVATPNGQAAFLFLLTSALAPLIRLSYGKMVAMALPYTIIMTLTGYVMVSIVLPDISLYLYEEGIIRHHDAWQAPPVTNNPANVNNAGGNH
jgi:NhaB family Na+:H+ antiporter